MGQLARPEAPQAPAPAGLAAGDAERVRKAFAAALAENTRRAYLGHWAAFGEWCAENGYPPAPAAPETVAAHLAAIAGTASASTLKAWRVAIGAVRRHGDPLHPPENGQARGRRQVPGESRLIRDR